jgi:hypothetical protein
MNLFQKCTGYCHLWCLAVLASVCLPATAQSDQPSIYKIEEDWELVVSSPRAAIHCPQVSIYTTPHNDHQGTYFQLQLNYAAREVFTGGGFMVSAVRNESTIQEARSDVREPLAHDGEQLRWTSVMAVINNELLFAIRDGVGNHWGEFGGPDYIVRMPAGSIGSLDHYSPQRSLETVDIGFGANRVQSLVLTKVRVFFTDSEMIETVINQSP